MLALPPSSSTISSAATVTLAETLQTVKKLGPPLRPVILFFFLLALSLTTIIFKYTRKKRLIYIIKESEDPSLRLSALSGCERRIVDDKYGDEKG